MLEGNLESKKDYYEMVSYAVKTAMASIYQGKDLKMFGSDEVAQDDKLTEEKRTEDIAYLEERFGEL